MTQCCDLTRRHGNGQVVVKERWEINNPPPFLLSVWFFFETNNRNLYILGSFAKAN